MIRYRIAIQPDSAIQNRTRIGLDFENISTGSDIQTALITAVECSEFFSDIKRIVSNTWILLPVLSEISDLCEISDLKLFLSYFTSQNNEIKFANYFFGVCCVN